MSEELFTAVRLGDTTAVLRLLQDGVGVDSADSRGQTPLMEAVRCRQIEVIRLLLERDADPNSEDEQGWTSTFLAVLHSQS
jgi:ankyrin repeat protein